MKTSTLKILALSTVAVAAIAVPVSANHNAHGLRGMFTGQHGGHGEYISQQSCDPCGWQAQKLQSRVQRLAQPTYVTGETNHMGLRGYSHSHDVRAAHRPEAQIYLQGYNAHTQQQYSQLAQLGHGLNTGQDYSAHYDPVAAQSFYRDRSFNVGGASVRTSVANTARMLDWEENTTGKALNLLANRYQAQMTKQAFSP